MDTFMEIIFFICGILSVFVLLTFFYEKGRAKGFAEGLQMQFVFREMGHKSGKL